MVLVHLLRLCFKKTNPNLFKNEQNQLQDCRPKSRRSGGWRDPLQNPLMPERSKQLLTEERWGLLPKALGYFIHLFPLTSANQHKLKRVKPVQKNKPWGKTGATEEEGRSQEVAPFPLSARSGARGGWWVPADVLKTGAFRQEAEQYFWSPIIMDHAALLRNILACSTGQIMLSVGNRGCYSFPGSFSWTQQSSSLSDPRSRFLW